MTSAEPLTLAHRTSSIESRLRITVPTRAPSFPLTDRSSSDTPVMVWWTFYGLRSGGSLCTTLSLPIGTLLKRISFQDEDAEDDYLAPDTNTSLTELCPDSPIGRRHVAPSPEKLPSPTTFLYVTGIISPRRHEMSSCSARCLVQNGRTLFLAFSAHCSESS